MRLTGPKGPPWRYQRGNPSSTCTWAHPKPNMGVSKNNGTPKSSILIGFSLIFTLHFGGKIPLFLVQHPYVGQLRHFRVWWRLWRLLGLAGKDGKEMIKLTRLVCTCKWAPKKEINHLPTIEFQGRFVSFREGMLKRESIWNKAWPTHGDVLLTPARWGLRLYFLAALAGLRVVQHGTPWKFNIWIFCN